MSVRQGLQRILPTLVWAGAAGAIVFAVNLRAQPPGPPPAPAAPAAPQSGTPETWAARAARMSAAADAKGLAEPYKGITTSDGKIVTGLFPIKSTGVSTEPVRTAATAFLAALTPDQRLRTAFGMDDPEWRKWMNQHFYKRQGVSFGEMAEPQREAAIGLLQASLSAKGLQLTRDIMRLNTTLAELNNNNFEEYGEGFYFITVMGAPSDKEPWGWQLDGHHLIVNYFVLGDQVVMTPAFFGSEPAAATVGRYKGLTVLRDEQSRALSFVNALTEAQRAKAILQVSKTGNNILTEAWRDNVTLDYAGVPASELTDAQKSALLDLANQYIGNMDAGHAKVRLEEVRRHLADTYFAWIGGTTPDSVFYYRIHSPVILIEFDHQTPVGMRNVVENPKAPFKEHIHTVMRTPNGNDYGKDLLRQHYEAHKNDPSHDHQR
jgi:hypothetical protein